MSSSNDPYNLTSPTAQSKNMYVQFLSAIMRHQYAEALKYCQLILQYEPHNSTARGFYPLLQHKVNAHANAHRKAHKKGNELLHRATQIIQPGH